MDVKSEIKYIFYKLKLLCYSGIGKSLYNKFEHHFQYTNKHQRTHISKA